MTQLHPIFEDVLAAHGMLPADQQDPDIAMQVRRAAYVKALHDHDWQFEFSDDHAVWTRGRNELQRLRAERADVDQGGVLWKTHAPADFRHDPVCSQ